MRTTASGSLYRLGLALLDLEQPERCLLRGDEWVFAPEEAYEREGDVNNVGLPGATNNPTDVPSGNCPECGDKIGVGSAAGALEIGRPGL